VTDRKDDDQVEAPPPEPSVEELRERRAELIKEQAQAEVDRVEAEQEAADKAGKHEAKIDDQGALEQQRAARENAPAIALANEGLEGPPVVAPQFEEADFGSLTVESRDPIQPTERDETGALVWPEAQRVSRTKLTMEGLANLRLVGAGYPAPGEIIIDVRREDGQDHQRFSAWTDDGRLDTPLPGINGPGVWVFRTESPVTQVGEGREDHLPVIRQGKDVKLTVR
jgi:hypothetical protein